jgi:hypothetical protein
MVPAILTGKMSEIYGHTTTSNLNFFGGSKSFFHQETMKIKITPTTTHHSGYCLSPSDPKRIE